MKKYVLLTALLLACLMPAMAWSQNAPGGNGGPPPQASGAPGGGDGERFEDRKAEVIKRINDRIAEAQKRLSCVQAAANREALRACMPERGGDRDGPR